MKGNFFFTFKPWHRCYALMKFKGKSYLQPHYSPSENLKTLHDSWSIILSYVTAVFAHSSNFSYCSYVKKRSRLLKVQPLMMDNLGATAFDSWNCQHLDLYSNNRVQTLKESTISTKMEQLITLTITCQIDQSVVLSQFLWCSLKSKKSLYFYRIVNKHL